MMQARRTQGRQRKSGEPVAFLQICGFLYVNAVINGNFGSKKYRKYPLNKAHALKCRGIG
jgi:hypothetical protein